MTTRKKAAEPGPPATTTYMLIMGDGKRKKVTVPTSWGVTFGPLVPGSKDATYNGRAATSLRFYEGKQQRAVFTGVESLRDMSIAIMEEEVRTETETFYKDEPSGRKEIVMEAAVREWRDPDDPKRPAPSGMARIPNALKAVPGNPVSIDMREGDA